MSAPTRMEVPSTPAVTDVRRARFRISGYARVEAAWLLATVSVTAIAVTFVLRLWEANARVPFVYAGDANLNATIIKGMIETGWYQRIPALGTPFGYDMHDFPLGGDNLQFLFLKVLTFFSSDWALILNGYFLLTFVLVSGVAYVVLRWFEMPRWLSLGLANLFALLPYHFIPGQHHLLLSGYLVVPLAAVLIRMVLAGGVGRGESAVRPVRRLRRRWAVPILLCVLIAIGGGYYAFFTVLLLAVAGGMALLSSRTRVGAVHAAILMAAIIGTGTINSLPSLLYWQENGGNSQVAQRLLGESNFYALHPVDLILPVDDHRLDPLAAIAEKADEAALEPVLAGAPNASLGILGTVGLVLSLLAVAAVSVDSGFTRALGRRRQLLAAFGILNIACMLIASVGGLSLLIAMAGFHQIRVWDRISVFVAFFSLMALGLATTAGLELLRERLERRSPGGFPLGRLRVVGFGLAGVALILGILDQTTTTMVPIYDINRFWFTSDRAFVEDVERLMPDDAAVFQLPIVSYPERPAVVNMYDYDLFRGYLHSTSLRWSYGAMRGRPADWSRQLAGRPVDTMVRQVAAAGFDGLYIDRDGFVDRAHELEVRLTALVGTPDVFSRDGSLAFFDLREFAGRQRAELGDAATARLGNQTLRPVTPAWGQGFSPLTFTPPHIGAEDAGHYPRLDGHSMVRFGGATATLELVNPFESPRPVELSFGLAGDTAVPGRLDVQAGATRFQLALTTTTVRHSLAVVLPPGETVVTFTTGTPREPGVHAFRIEDFLIDDAAEPAARR